MQLLIEQLDKREFDGKFGKYWKVGIYANGKWYGTPEKDWNRGWEVGNTIDVEVEQVTGKNGKTYNNILPPGKSSGGSGQDSLLLERIATILERIELILSKRGS